MEPKCKKCGGIEDLGIYIGNVKNLAPEAIYCRSCVPTGYTDKNEHGEVYYKTEEIPIEDLSKIAMMENPDIACDFCNKPNPQWLYDLSMEAMETLFGVKLDFGDRWNSCGSCVELMESGKIPNKPDIEGMSAMHQLIHLTHVEQLHKMVIDCIHNKRHFVRDDRDGRVKVLE